MLSVHVLQALQVLETLIIKDSDKLEIRDKQAVSCSCAVFLRNCSPANGSSLEAAC